METAESMEDVVNYEAEYNYIDGRFVDVITGEIIKPESLRKSIERQSIDIFREAMVTLQHAGINSTLRMIKTRKGAIHYCVKIKENYTFNKVFRVDMRWLLENVDLTEREQLFMFRFEHYLHFPSNSIVVNGNHPTVEDMMKMMKLKSDKVVRNTINSLEQKQIIKTEQIGNRRIIYFNPFLISTGGIIDIDTYTKFQFSRFNPECSNK